MSSQSRFGSALLDPEHPVPDNLYTWHGGDATSRFNVYRNNVVVSLIEALAATFEVTEQLVGRRFFRAMAREYIPEHLPDSPVLALYGESFPRFIEHFPPTAQLPWLGDLARLEWLRVRACHAADAEPLSTEASAHPEALDALLASPLQLHPSVGLVDSRWAVTALWAAHQEAGRLDQLVLDRPEQALITRPALEVEVRLVPPGTRALVQRLKEGLPLGEAINQTLAQQTDFNPSLALKLLLDAGALLAPQTTPRRTPQ